MSTFTIEFDSLLIAAGTADEIDRVRMPIEIVTEPLSAPTTSAPAQPVPDFTLTTTAIETALKNVFAELSSQHAALQTTAGNYAVEIVRVLLGSTEDIIEQRLRQNVARVLDHPDECSVAKLFVHSTNRDAIENWLLKSESFKSLDATIEVQADNELKPGDCRVDFGQSGRLAALDEQLKLVESRLKQMIRDDQAGDHE